MVVVVQGHGRLPIFRHSAHSIQVTDDHSSSTSSAVGTTSRGRVNTAESNSNTQRKQQQQQLGDSESEAARLKHLPPHHRDKIVADLGGSDLVAKSPHLFKNPFIFTHYHVAESPQHALWSACFRLHNETANIYSGFLPVLIGASLLYALANTGLPLDDTVAQRVAIFAAACIVNGLLVAVYHTVCSHPGSYHLGSSLDLGGISLAAVGYWACRFIPGMGMGVPSSFSTHDTTSLLSEHDVFIRGSVALLLLALCIMSMRVLIGRESPPWLLALNAAPYLPLMLDYCFARYDSQYVIAPHGVPTWWLCPASVLLGLSLYILKLPERFARNGAFDLFGGGHTLWHCFYALCFGMYGFDALACCVHWQQQQRLHQ